MTPLTGAIAAALLLCACGPTREAAPAIDANPACYQAHVASLTDTGVRWDAGANDPEAWDDLGERVVGELVARALAGERSRRSCVDFIESLRKRGVIRAPARP